MNNELITIQPASIADVFTKDGGADPILEAIKKEVSKHVPDISSKKGREEIASLAYKVAKTKTYMDNLGASLVEDIKKQVKLVDGSRKKIRDYLDELKDETRKPLTDWENKEKNRIANHEAKIEEIATLSKSSKDGYRLTIAQMKENLEKIKAIDTSETIWEEFYLKAARVQYESIGFLEKDIADREQYEREQAELKKLREEAAAREAQEKEERIKKEAAEKATREAEEKALAERKEVERKKEAELKKIQQEKEAAENESKIAAQKQAEAERKLAEEKEKSRKALEIERSRYEKIKEQEEAERVAREKDNEHKKKINNEILADLRNITALMEPQAKVVIKAIAQGLIRNVKINY